MKKLGLVLIALIALLGLVGCPGTNDGDTDGDFVDTLGAWQVKGSFDGWTEHAFEKDPVDANKGFFIYEGLYATSYDFVVMDGTTEYKFSATNNGDTTALNVDTNYTLVSEKPYGNGVITAEKKAYKIEIDVTTPTAPVVTVKEASDEAAIPITDAMRVQGLKIKGDQFSIGWTDTDGEYDAKTNTIKFSVTVSNKNGSFGIESKYDAFLANGEIASPTDIGEEFATIDCWTGNNGNFKLTGVPKVDTKYDIYVSYNYSDDSMTDEEKENAANKYGIRVVMTQIGTEDWAFDVPTTIYIAGEGLEGIDWNLNTDAAKSTTVASNVATFDLKATKTTAKVKLNSVKSWDGAFGFGTVRVADDSLTVVDDSGNLMIENIVVDTVYTVTVTFDDTFVSTGEPLFKMAAKN